jgi:glycosyltransferase involved in cell wall biosynthesis
MKILLVHNFYQQRGGEDQVFADECELLKSYGHHVVTYTAHNDEMKQMGGFAAARNTFWNRKIHAELTELIRRERPAVMHCHNTFPLVSPAAYDAARRAGAAVVQTLHNYRLICANAQFLRNGKVCEDCLHKSVPWPAVLHGCYRASRPASAVLAGMLSFHRLRGTWQRQVDRFIALTEFARDKFVEAGLPAARISVKPNFVSPDLGSADGTGNYAVFVGRLAPEKGLPTLLAAWAREPRLPTLKIVGDGPLAKQVRQAAATDSRIEWLGHQSTDTVQQIMGVAKLLVFPSLWYEGLPKTIVESFGRGTPVVASDLGAMAELIESGVNGWLYEPGDAAALAQTVMRMPAGDDYVAVRAAARASYERQFTAEANYLRLIEIYREALIQAERFDAAQQLKMGLQVEEALS